MKPTPLLDFWQKPAEAGAPVALLATTFALEPDFFEQNCLARFLEVSSVNEGTGSIDDIVASVELHELLQKTCVTVLADRSAPVQRTSLLWDLLSCQVNGGLLHAKVAVLLWENATRVILGSANLTAAGYRRQIELGLAADLGPECLFPTDVLTEIAKELESYLLLVPGYDADSAVFARAMNTLQLFQKRINQQQRKKRMTVQVAFAPTNTKVGPLDRLPDVWSGPQPLWAKHLSPFWDSSDSSALDETRRLLTGRPANERSQSVAVALSPRGQTPFSRYLSQKVETVRQLKIFDKEFRTLHAKCLLIESNEWVAALVGSSNHTKSGLGLQRNRHREMNVWLGAPKDSKEGKALLDLIQLGDKVSPDAEEVEPKDEDQVELPAFPACFGLCRVTRSKDDSTWELHLGICTMNEMPSSWEIGLGVSDPPFLTRTQWEAKGAPQKDVIALKGQTVPMYVFVRWNENKTPWAVIADDRHGLPPGPALASLRAQHLLKALASGRSLTQLLREEWERKNYKGDAISEINLDPLKRFEVEGSLLRKGRALAASLNAMQQRLERPVITADTLSARLRGPLGPEFVATKVAEAFETGQMSRAEAIFTIAEIVLAVGRINWVRVIEHIDHLQGLALINKTLELLNAQRIRIGKEPVDLASYAHRAINKALELLDAQRAQIGKEPVDLASYAHRAINKDRECLPT